MFGLKELKRRINQLEYRVNELWNAKQCAAGAHEWEAKEISSVRPFIRCKHCYARAGGG